MYAFASHKHHFDHASLNFCLFQGTQYEILEDLSSSHANAKLSVPSGQPAFLFYAPSSEAAKYTSVFRDVMKGTGAKQGMAHFNCSDGAAAILVTGCSGGYL